MLCAVESHLLEQYSPVFLFLLKMSLCVLMSCEKDMPTPALYANQVSDRVGIVLSATMAWKRNYFLSEALKCLLA